MSWTKVPAGKLMAKSVGSVDPSKFPLEEFELFSIPAFDGEEPEILPGSQIGSSKKSVVPNDVLLSRIVPHIRRCWVVPEAGTRRQIASGEWITFRSDDVYPEYLKHFLTSDLFHRQFMQTVSGVGGSLLRARPSEVERIEIPLPPLKEQKRIAAILDKADAIRRKRQQAIQLADQFLRAVFLDMFGDPVTNPKGWDVVALKELTMKIGSGATPRGGNSAYVDEGVSLIRSMNVHDDRFIHDDLAHLTPAQADSLSNVVVEADDVLLNITGASVCRCAMVDNAVLPARVNQHVCIVRPRPDVLLPDYLVHLLISSSFKRRLLAIAGGAGATREALTKGQLEELEIPVPPLGLQERFSKVNRKVKASAEKQKLALHAPLFESLSQRAFAGEL